MAGCDSTTGATAQVMEHLDGVPILDVELMQELDKVEFMTKLIRSFGVMILRDGVFHTDPHPGNLLALHNHQTGQTAVGLLDFGQVRHPFVRPGSAL